jgi:hypothetical protein
LDSTPHGGAFFVVQLAIAIRVKSLDKLFHPLGIARAAVTAGAISVLRQGWACDQQRQRGDG